jgi:hypothetical protein
LEEQHKTLLQQKELFTQRLGDLDLDLPGSQASRELKSAIDQYAYNLDQKHL